MQGENKEMAMLQNSPQRQHVHSNASYRVYRLEDGAFGVEVSIPDTEPTHVTWFRSRAKAKDWIEEHKQTVERQSAAGRGLPFFLRQSKRDGA
jgi:hypothetical protein